VRHEGATGAKRAQQVGEMKQRNKVRASCAFMALTFSSAVLATEPQTVVLQAKRVYTSPDAAPIDSTAVLMRDGRIVAVGKRDEVAAPQGANTLACPAGVVVAGFQNSHVHFTEPQWEKAGTRPAGELGDQLTRMLTRYGVTTAVDVGSNPTDTVALRERIARGEVVGPRIYTAGLPLYPYKGLPFYIKDLPPEILAILPQPATAEETLAHVRRNFEVGADMTKLFVATPQAPGGKIAYMAEDVARTAVEEAHKRQRLVVAHPSSSQGIRLAIASGVDVLMHTTIEENPAVWDAALVQDLLAHDVALVPTLKLWPYELKKAKLPERVVNLVLGDAIEQLRAFSAAGGQVLFGTDVGYMTEYDPTDEYVFMSHALTPMQILTSLTVAPAARWQESQKRGRVAPGFDADLVVLGADPAQDVRNFADVSCTIRGGRVIYSR